MDEQHRRYFFIDTQPSDDGFIVPTHYHEDDYESDHIDEEIEHRLYSMIHHSTDPIDDPISDGITSDQQPQEFNSSNSNPGNKGKAVEQNDGDLRVTCDNLLLNLNTKRKRNSPTNSSNNKKNKQSSNLNTPNHSPYKPEVNQRTPSIIYLSDSDEDTTEDGTSVVSVKRDLWHVDYKDILISNPVSGKFYRPRIWCSRCRKEGNHPVKLCHLPKHKICYICGGIGHLGQHCQNQHCKRCMDFHRTSSCPLNVRDFKCKICSKFGHLDEACPNHWRRFHNITDPQVDPDTHTDPIAKNTRKSCSNCGHHKHYSFECDKLRNRGIEISSPYDINTTSVGHPVTPSRKNKPKSPRKNIFHFNPNFLGATPIATKIYGRPRYFNGEPDHSHFDLTLGANHTPNTNSVVPSNSPQQQQSKNSKKKQKRKKKNNNKRSTQQQSSNIEVITTGGPIISGKVKKAKTRQQNRKAKKKFYKMRHLTKTQSNGKHPNLFSYNNMMCANNF